MSWLRASLLLLLWGCVLPVLGAEQILDYRIAIDIQSDGSLDVTEDIVVRAEGQQIRRGIFRDFPTRYRDRRGNNVVVGFEVLSVERDGSPEPWFTEKVSNGVRVNTGGDEFLPVLPGEYRFRLRYRTTRQLGFFPDNDELYWNAIGTGWLFPILAGEVVARLPTAVPMESIGVEAYTGPQGAQGQAYRATVTAPGEARWQLSAPLAPSEGLTIVMTFPKGVVVQPGATQRLMWLLVDNRSLLAALAGLLVMLGYMTRRWLQVGRDPRPGVIIARYEPPAERSPAELRYLQKGTYDMRCFTADLLTSAVDGQVIVECEARRLRKDRWQLQRTHAEPLSSFATAKTLLSSLLPTPGETLVLENTQASRVQKASKAHFKALDARLHGSHFQRNGRSTAMAALLVAMTAAVAIWGFDGGGRPLTLVVLGVMVASIFLFSKLIAAPTAEGRKLLDQAEGLKRYLSVAERDELAAMGGPGQPPVLDAERYQSLLPYAVALEVEEAWTGKFTAAVGAAAAAAAAAGISWYRGGRVSDMGSFAKSLGDGLNSSIASASTPPGSSSGSGGGGSSGGGGGGGGGGGR